MYPQQLEGLIALLYATLEEPDAWDGFLDALCTAMGASSAGVSWHGLRTPEVAQRWVGLPDAFSRAYTHHFHREDPWVLAGGASVRAGTTYLGTDLVPDAMLRRTAFYNDLCAPHGFHDLCGGVIERRGDDGLVSIGLFSGMRRGFRPSDQQTLQRLMPHLQRVVRLQRALDDAHAERDDARKALDHAPFGVLTVTITGVLLDGNRTGAALLRDGDALTVHHGVLRAVHPADDHLLHAALQNGGDQVLRIPRPNRRPLALWCAPATRRATFFNRATPVIAVYVMDPELAAPSNGALLRRLFGLTPAEVRLAEALALGMTVQEAARVLHISVLTARTQLKRVLAKTSTNRQVELVLLLSRVSLPR